MRITPVKVELNQEKLDALKKVLDMIGLDVNEAVNAFVDNVILEKRLPFKIQEIKKNPIPTQKISIPSSQKTPIKAINYEPTIMKKDDHYALNAVHIRHGEYGGFRIIELKKPSSPEQSEMIEALLYENDEMTLERAKDMALEYAVEENEENGNFYKWIFIPLD